MGDDSENINTEDWTTEQWKSAYEEQVEKAETNRSGWMRAQADYQNYKKRIQNHIKHKHKQKNLHKAR